LFLRTFAMSPSKSLFILGLLLNVGCLAAHSPVRREYSVKADGNIQAESQSRSLIAELANMLPEEEAQQTQSLLMLAEEGAPKDELTKMVGDLKSKIPPWRTDAMATLQKSVDAIEKCATEMNGAVAQWPEKKNQCDAQGDSHTSCREEESKKFQEMTHWKGQRAEKKEVMDTECKIFDDVKKEARAATASYSSGDEESYLEGVCEEFSALQPRYEDAKKKCTAAKADHAKVVEIYEQAESAYTAEKKVCDEKQTQAEVSYCQYALTTKGTCDAYGTCYEDKVAEYTKVKEIIESEEKLNKVEWRVYSRIECLLPLLGTDKADEIEKCRKKTYSLEDVVYPDVPGKDACTIETAYPSTNAYYTAHMAPLPEDAKGGPVATCVGLAPKATVTTQSASDYCAAQCQAAGFCCNDWRKGSNQMISCAQACMMRSKGSKASELTAANGGMCKRHGQSGCSVTVASVTYGFCSSCSDLKPGNPKCSFGVASPEACDFGATLSPPGAEE